MASSHLRSRGTYFCTSYGTLLPQIGNPVSHLPAVLPTLSMAPRLPSQAEFLCCLSDFLPVLSRHVAGSSAVVPSTTPLFCAYGGGSALSVHEPVDEPVVTFMDDTRSVVLLSPGLGNARRLVSNQPPQENPAGSHHQLLRNSRPDAYLFARKTLNANPSGVLSPADGNARCLFASKAPPGYPSVLLSPGLGNARRLVSNKPPQENPAGSHHQLLRNSRPDAYLFARKTLNANPSGVLSPAVGNARCLFASKAPPGYPSVLLSPGLGNARRLFSDEAPKGNPTGSEDNRYAEVINLVLELCKSGDSGDSSEVLDNFQKLKFMLLREWYEMHKKREALNAESISQDVDKMKNRKDRESLAAERVDLEKDRFDLEKDRSQAEKREKLEKMLFRTHLDAKTTYDMWKDALAEHAKVAEAKAAASGSTGKECSGGSSDAGKAAAAGSSAKEGGGSGGSQAGGSEDEWTRFQDWVNKKRSGLAFADSLVYGIFIVFALASRFKTLIASDEESGPVLKRALEFLLHKLNEKADDKIDEYLPRE